MGMRFAVVGTGYWARETHATALAAHPDANLVGVWGRSFARAAELAEAFGARPYERVDDMFADVDAVAFAVPPDVQADLAVRAARRGCHLLLDKPVAFTTEAADRIVEAVDGAGVRSLVFLTSRFTANQADWLTDVQKEPAWNSGYVRIYGSIFEPGNPFGESEWRRSRGALWDIGPHALSILVPALGPVTHIIADHGLGDTVTIVLHHQSGAASTMSLSLTAPPGSLGSAWQLFGKHRQTSMPEATTTPVEAMGACISTLLTEQPGRWQHPCDVSFGRDVVTILQAADVFLTATARIPRPTRRVAARLRYLLFAKRGEASELWFLGRSLFHRRRGASSPVWRNTPLLSEIIKKAARASHGPVPYRDEHLPAVGRRYNREPPRRRLSGRASHSKNGSRTIIGSGPRMGSGHDELRS